MEVGELWGERTGKGDKNEWITEMVNTLPLPNLQGKVHSHYPPSFIFSSHHIFHTVIPDTLSNRWTKNMWQYSIVFMISLVGWMDCVELNLKFA